MSEAKKALVFGGSFDPPHIGHMNLLENAISAVAPGEVFVVPSGTAPHKQASATPGPLRLAMCQCFTPLFPHLVVGNWELCRPGKSYTVDTMATLQAEYPGREWYLCIGADMLLGFATWHRYKQLLGMATLVAGGRGEKDETALRAAAKALEDEGGRVLLAKGPVVPASSSGIRAALAGGDEEALLLIPPPADDIVRQNGLYR
ncbi:nicotinate (nicotinamide) nucleotide adenylyltransferase [Ruminococcaceae bacterium OttesenSCG-928-O06]|nr:nicotinate (nicotinamide) nucleotide adenylyltransferase [Ruminococcaceae bacterium OttesenSCG-928-O06]